METGTLTLSEELGVLAKLRADAATHDDVRLTPTVVTQIGHAFVVLGLAGKIGLPPKRCMFQQVTQRQTTEHGRFHSRARRESFRGKRSVRAGCETTGSSMAGLFAAPAT